MLADPRAFALSSRFASQWLRLQDLDKIHPDSRLFPQFDTTLADAMRTETQLLFDSIVREDRDVLNLLTADYTFVDERLARHYGIPNITGPEFRRVALADENRRGLLGQGSILTMTSVADRTSPVLRGKWVLEVLFGMPPPPPPPDVPLLDERQRRTAAAHGAPAHGGASQESELPFVPSRDRSDRARARELRRDRHVAYPRRPVAGRSVGSAL
jgi:hypothetical protein